MVTIKHSSARIDEYKLVRPGRRTSEIIGLYSIDNKEDDLIFQIGRVADFGLTVTLVMSDHHLQLI